MLSLSSVAKIAIKRSPVTVSLFHSSAAALEIPFPRRINRRVLHEEQKPAELNRSALTYAVEDAKIDFDSLGLTYKVKHNPELVIQDLVWPAKAAVLPNLPFSIDRTNSLAALPVYTDFVGDSNKVTTILKKFKGDVNVLKTEVEKVVGKSVQLKSGRIVIEGNYNRRLKLWLVGLGF